MMNRRKCSLCMVLAMSALSFSGCFQNKGQAEGEVHYDSVAVCHIDTVPAQNGPDQTVYGKGTDFGMSTFTLVTAEGKEYDVTRVSEAGEEGKIFGTVAPQQRYAMMTGDEDEALVALINLDELEHFVGKQYYIYNGQLVLTIDGNREWVDIQELSRERFVALGKTGKSYCFEK